MSFDSRQVTTLVAVLLLVFASGVVWQVAAVREQQAKAATTEDLVPTTVDTRQAPTDYDGDGLDDATDRCPTRPETTNGFQDGDGCPDVVTTTRAS